jgi:uncharacterized coiled-coil protein SlyX
MTENEKRDLSKDLLNDISKLRETITDLEEKIAVKDKLIKELKRRLHNHE